MSEKKIEMEKCLRQEKRKGKTKTQAEKICKTKVRK